MKWLLGSNLSQYWMWLIQRGAAIYFKGVLFRPQDNSLCLKWTKTVSYLAKSCSKQTVSFKRGPNLCVFRTVYKFGFHFLTSLHVSSVTILIVCIMKVKNDHRSKFSNLSNWKEEAWKKNHAYRTNLYFPLLFYRFILVICQTKE